MSNVQYPAAAACCVAIVGVKSLLCSTSASWRFQAENGRRTINSYDGFSKKSAMALTNIIRIPGDLLDSLEIYHG